jgi:hypothetical protein
MLLKVTAGFFFVALWGVLLLESIGVGRRRSTWRLFPQPRSIWPWFMAALVPVVLWYAYSQYYNVIHANPFTDTGLSPWWRMSATEIAHALHQAGTIVVFEIFSASVWWMFLGFFIAACLFCKVAPVAGGGVPCLFAHRSGPLPGGLDGGLE